LAGAATGFCGFRQGETVTGRIFAMNVNDLLTFLSHTESSEHCAVRCSIAAWEKPPAAPVHGRMSRQFKKPAH
jgi:hypothetical protein